MESLNIKKPNTNSMVRNATYNESPQVSCHQSKNIPIVNTFPIINHTINENIINNNFYVNNDNKSKLLDNFKRIISKYHISHNFVNELLLILRNERLIIFQKMLELY